MIENFKFFANIEVGGQRRKLVRMLKLVTVQAGKWIIRQGEVDNEGFFMVSISTTHGTINTHTRAQTCAYEDCRCRYHGKRLSHPALHPHTPPSHTCSYSPTFLHSQVLKGSCHVYKNHEYDPDDHELPPWEALKAPGAQHTAAGHRRGSIADPLTRSGYGEKRVTLSAGDSFGEVW